MIPASQPLIDLLASRSFSRAELYSLTLITGQVLRWTSADIDVTATINSGGTQVTATWSHSGPKCERGDIVEAVGIEVSTMDLTITVDDESEPSINGVPFRRWVGAKGLAGAFVELHNVYAPALTLPLVVTGTLPRFAGSVADIELLRNGCKVTVKSMLNLLTVSLPRALYTAQCRFSFGDGGCGVNITALGQAGTISAATATTITCGLTQAAGYFANGQVLFTSGANAGLRRAIRSSAPGQIVLTGPAAFVPAVGDTFIAFPGCDKTYDSCIPWWGALAQNRFGGEPNIPAPETAL
jgi:Uncharacterized conserved protein (DUF2163)/Phage conserved hypothetical protein BR0599